MPLCPKQLKKFYGSLLAVFAMLLGGAFFITSPAKAADGEVINGYHQDSGHYTYNGTITDGMNQTLVCLAHGFWNLGTYSIPRVSLKWHDQTMTRFGGNDGDNGQWQLFYLNNPDIGNYDITDDNNYTNALSCTVFENVDQENPIAGYSGDTIIESGYTATGTAPFKGLLFTRSYGTYTEANYSYVNQGFAASEGASYNYGYSEIATSSNIWVANYSGGIQYKNVWVQINTFLPPTMTADYVHVEPTTKTMTASGKCTKVGSGLSQLVLHSDVECKPNPLIAGACEADLQTVDCVGSSTDALAGTWSATYQNMSFTGHHTMGMYDQEADGPGITWDTNWDITTAPSSVATTTDVGLFGKTSSQMACSDDEWNTPDPQAEILGARVAMPAFNMTKNICYVKKLGFDSMIVFSNIVKSIMNVMISAISNVFPFNLAIKTFNCWNSSAIATMPTDLAWLDIFDNQGNAYLTVPQYWTGASTSTLLIWGHDIFTPTGSPQAAFFAHVKILIKWLSWAALMFIVINICEDIYDEIRYENVKTKHRQNDWQL